ncbi:MAG: hypothetical protein AAF598_10425, partial [Bacteroidota bacterium]
ENVRRIPEYTSWAYQANLEDRLAKTRIAIAAQSNLEMGSLLDYDRCMVCHQEKQLAPSPKNVHQHIPLSASGNR